MLKSFEREIEPDTCGRISCYFKHKFGHILVVDQQAMLP
jgi:hypothetical protein